MASRRLDISSLLCDDDQPAFSPLDALVHAATEERRRLDASHITFEQRFHDDQPTDRALLDRRRDDERRSRIEYERQQQQQQLHQLQLQQQQQKQREYEQRLHEERLLEQEHLRELERQQRLRNEHREREQRQIERDRLERDRFAQQQQQQLLLHQQQQHAQREQERLDLLHRQHRQQSSVSASHSPSINHLISHTPHRHPDPPQISTLLPIAHIISAPVPTPSHHDDHRPIKKRRYSESPTRPPPEDRERIARERDKMAAGELGYGRVESPIAGPSYPPRRPGSGHGPPRKPVSVSDLLSDREPPRPHSREAEAHRVVSPLGRRSPPGSQIGRAKAARKSDEFLFREPPPIIHTALEHTEVKRSPKEDLKVKQEPKQHSRPRTGSFLGDTRPKKPSKELAPPPPPPPPPPPTLSKIQSAKAQQDAHEWFLQHYDEDLSPTTSARPEPPHTPSPSLSPLTPAHPPPPPISVPDEEKPPLTPITSAVATLEQELAELVSDPTTTASTPTTIFVKKQEPEIDMDLDVDLAVTELVDTMENDDDDVKREPRMEVDVEDELLSLVDDRPPPPPPPPVSARRAPGSAGSSSHGSAAAPSTSTVALSTNVKPTALPHRSVSEARQASPPVMSASTAPVSAVSSTSAARQTSTRPTSERGSMPPPASVGSGSGKKSTERAGSAVPGATAGGTAAKKKKEPAAKAVPKAKAAATAAAKPKAKPAAKAKKVAANDIVTPPVSAAATAALAVPPPSKMAKTTTGRKTAPSVSASRSRSASVMPTSVGPESDTVKAEKQEEEEESEEENEDDKLYCVCKTKYDEDRFMIACDRCDEWYHTQCVHMPDLEVDLVDQFICPPCIEKNPHLNLRTTYKTRCLYGLRHPDPSSTKACHKAARGAFSKYCSDECGVKYMQSRIDTWAKKGGKTEKLWESVKSAEKREGVVVCAAEPEPETNGCVKMESSDSKGDNVKGEGDVDGDSAKPGKPHIVPPKKSKIAQETDRLNKLLDSVIKLREEIKRDMEIVVCRERLLKLATDRAEAVGQCGWDQRLCMDEEEWADIGDTVFESYEDGKAVPVKEEGADGDMEVDNPEEQWWCPGKVVCDRHAGWQTVRLKDVSKEKAKMEEALEKLTTREREIRKNIEDMLDPQTNAASATSKNTLVKETASSAPLKSSNTKTVNGNSKSKAATGGETLKKGKKRKAPA